MKINLINTTANKLREAERIASEQKEEAIARIVAEQLAAEPVAAAVIAEGAEAERAAAEAAGAETIAAKQSVVLRQVLYMLVVP